MVRSSLAPSFFPRSLWLQRRSWSKAHPEAGFLCFLTMQGPGQYKRLRDLAHRNTCAAGSSSREAPAGFAMQPQYPPDMAAVIAAQHSGLSHQFMDSITFSLSPEVDTLFEGWAYKEDVEAAGAVDDILGRYWKVADNYNGAPVWRQEASEQKSGGGWSLWRESGPPMAGWCVGPTFGDTSDTNLKGWCKNISDHCHPTHVHIPFLCKHTNPMVALQIPKFLMKELNSIQIPESLWTSLGFSYIGQAQLSTLFIKLLSLNVLREILESRLCKAVVCLWCRSRIRFLARKRTLCEDVQDFGGVQRLARKLANLATHFFFQVPGGDIRCPRLQRHTHE